jgi:D-aspartate ligase
MESPGAVITGGDFQGLGVVRSLGRRGIPVHVLDHELSIARFSRFCRKYTVAPDPAAEDAYVSFLLDYGKGLRPRRWVLFPNCDRVVYLLSKHKKTLEEFYYVPTPDWEVIRHVYNKKNSYQLADSLGIPTPRTYYPRDRRDLEKLDLSFPLISARSVRRPS